MYGCAAPGQLCRMLSMVSGQGSLFHLKNVNRIETRPEGYKTCYLCGDLIEGWDMRRIVIIHCTDCFSRCLREDKEGDSNGPVLIHPFCLALKKDIILRNTEVFQMPAVWLNATEMQNKAMCYLLRNLYLLKQVKSLGEAMHVDIPCHIGKEKCTGKEPEKVSSFVFPGTVAEVSSGDDTGGFWNADVTTLPDNVFYCDSLAASLDNDLLTGVFEQTPCGSNLLWDIHSFRQATYGVPKPGIYTKSARSLA